MNTKTDNAHAAPGVPDDTGAEGAAIRDNLQRLLDEASSTLDRHIRLSDRAESHARFIADTRTSGVDRSEYEQRVAEYVAGLDEDDFDEDESLWVHSQARYLADEMIAAREAGITS